MASTEQNSSFQFTLSTGNDSEYYDKTIALSQALVNVNFRDLFETTEGVARIAHSDDVAGDRIFGELDAPTHVNWPYCIKSADVVFLNGQTRTLSQWVLTVKVNLGEVSLEVQSSDDEETQRNKEYWKQGITRRCPGFIISDYRVQRIFANFSGTFILCPPFMNGKAKLRTPIISIVLWISSEAELKHRLTVPYQPWASSFPYIRNRVSTAMFVLSDVTDIYQNRYSSLSNLQLGHAWKVYHSHDSPPSQEENMTHSYNLSFLVSNDGPKIPESLGTFSIYYKVVMDRYLLPTIEGLCLATVVKIEEPERTITADVKNWDSAIPGKFRSVLYPAAFLQLAKPAVDSVLILRQGRAGFGPKLELSYNSGSGNGSFEIGWQLNSSSITRMTSKRTPMYDETDSFLLSGEDELARLGDPERNGDDFYVRSYQPRVMGDPLKIEQWN
ncbi:domain containing protein [Fusarium agapanthi]|uniref:Domain containing protein n=1 Tax=Fusarium agapanthi TaxID=1803897 RepID=A0A9P5E7L7_9HYPO|nr:domain containing protein [Fusarium agapanthi]